MRYLFDYWGELKKGLNNKYIILFLDYDGTLSPIVDSPDKALIPKETKGLLCRLSEDSNCGLAIISGRALSDVKRMVGLKKIIYVGNHGLEIEGPKIKFESSISAGYRTMLKQIKNSLNKKIANIKGAFIEDKGLTLSVHYRLVDKKLIPLLKTIFHETIIIYLVRNKIKIRPGKMMLEIRPPVEWDKGRVVLWLLVRYQFALKNKNVFPIYIGDDITDENAFRALRNRGLNIFVGNPKDSCAQYYLKDTQEVREFLKQILELKNI